MANVFEYTLNYIWTGFTEAFSNLGQVIPLMALSLLVALFFIVIGWIVGNFAKKALIEILKFAKVDEWAKEHNLKDAIGGIPLSVLAGSLLKWYVVLLFLEQAADSVRLNSIKVFLKALVYYIPLLLFALVVLGLGLLLGKYVRHRVEATSHAYKKSIASLSELLIIYLSVVLALDSIGVNVDILKSAFLIAFSAFVLVLALVFGVSLGLAYKNEARELVNTVKKELREMK